MFYKRLLPILQPKTPALRLIRPTLAVLVMLLLVPTGSNVGKAEMLPAREAVPSMLSPIVDEAGNGFTMKQLAEGPVLLNFWATWCAPCVAELPALSRAAAALADDGVTVVLVSVDRGGAQKAVPFLDRSGVSGVTLGFDQRAKLSREMGVRGLPTTLLLTAGQTDAWRFIGPLEWDDPDVLGMVRGLLDG